MAEGKDINRRSPYRAGASPAGAGLMAPATAQKANATELEADLSSNVGHHLLAFRATDWPDHVEDSTSGVTIYEATSRTLHYWSADRPIGWVHPTSVPLPGNLTRGDRTKAVGKRVNAPSRPSWAVPERDPEWPEAVEGGDPTKPLGTRALCIPSAFTASAALARSAAVPREAASAFVANALRITSNSPATERRSC